MPRWAFLPLHTNVPSPVAFRSVVLPAGWLLLRRGHTAASRPSLPPPKLAKSHSRRHGQVHASSCFGLCLRSSASMNSSRSRLFRGAFAPLLSSHLSPHDTRTSWLNDTNVCPSLCRIPLYYPMKCLLLGGLLAPHFKVPLLPDANTSRSFCMKLSCLGSNV